MNGKKSINKEHPDYPEYIEKCRALSERAQKAESEILARYPDWRGQDHPADAEIYPIRKQFNAALKELQEEYKRLFS